MLSKHYKYWKSVEDERRCVSCEDNHGKVYAIDEDPKPKPKLHPWCRCAIRIMEAILAGTATKKGIGGADWWLVNFFTIPNYYITQQDAFKMGWIPSAGNLAAVAPNKMITKGEYKNRNQHLPVAPGRIWYEVDIDYSYGYRGDARIVFSNDGLIFATYDHYNTFVEVITEEDDI